MTVEEIFWKEPHKNASTLRVHRTRDEAERSKIYTEKLSRVGRVELIDVIPVIDAQRQTDVIDSTP